MTALDFQTPLQPFGVSGLDLHRSIELIEGGKYARLTNVVRTEEGAFTGRPGETGLFTLPVSDEIHSLSRVNNVPTGAFIRLAGAGTKVYTGTTGLFIEADQGYSGDPLTIVSLRPPLSGEAWAYIGDSAQMRKIRVTDSLATDIGLSKAVTVGGRFRIDEFARTPDGSINASDRSRFVNFGFDISAGGTGDTSFVQLAAEKTKTIDTCDAAGWTNNTGTGSGAPSNTTDAVDKKQGTASLKLTTNGPATAFYQFWAKANALNLSAFSDSTGATDDDIIHCWMKVDRPDLVQEVRVYLVCSTPFDTATVPGTSATANTDAFLKTIRPADFTALYEASVSTLPAASAFNAAAQTLGRLSEIEDDRTGLASLIRQQTESIRALALQMAPGRSQWGEFGAIGSPLYRGDFRRIGSDQSRAWGDITGVVILVQGTGGNVNIWFDDIYMRGGYGPDTSPLGTQGYDYRYRNYDPRVGVKSNPSDEQSGRFAVNPLRQAVVLTPNAYGDSAIRQQFFRRGGALVSNWYFLGTNLSDGGTFTDIFSDDELKAADILETDNDKPVTTTAADGSTVYEQPLPSIWGPVLGLLMGCGDPYQPGVIFWSKQDQYDHWPVANQAEACAPSEQLMAGCVFLGQGYAFSRARLFNCYVNLAGGGVVTPTPTACRHGLASRWGLKVGKDGIYFVSDDGVYKTTGGIEESISDADLYPIFHGQSKNGYLPVDFTVPEAIRLEIYQNELYFLYRDTGGTNRVLVYSLAYQFWRFYSFGRELASLNAEDVLDGELQALALGGRSTGAGYTLAGTSDDGLPIAAQLRTGAMNQGYPRNEKSYGDLVHELNPAGTTITVTPYVNAEATALQAQGVTGATRALSYLDFADAGGNPGPYLARNLSLDYAWATAAAPPTLYQFGPSFIVQPDDIALRATDWDSGGTPAAKWVKGILLEVDTQGAAKSVTIEADYAAQTVITVQAAGRRSLEFTWTKFRGQLLRLRPTGGGTLKIFSYSWIFDEEPLSLTRWESQETNFRVDAPGGFSLLYACVMISSSADVTLVVEMTRHSGTILTLTPPALPSTGGVKRKIFVPFDANKGVLSRWIFTSAAPFYLYREESEVAVEPWAGELQVVRPFGNDDLDSPRGMGRAETNAQRAGGA